MKKFMLGFLLASPALLFVSCTSGTDGLSVQGPGTTTGETTGGDLGSRTPVISQISVTNVTQSSAVITFTTDIAAQGEVDYGTSASYGASSSEESQPAASHSITLTGLASGTKYHFQIIEDNFGTEGVSADQTFTTTGTPGGPPASSPPTIGQVKVFGIGKDSATITWRTNIGSTSQIKYGATASYGSATAVDSTLKTFHSVTVTGLTAATRYHFQVVSKASGATGVSGDDTFGTAFSGGLILVPVKKNGKTTLLSIKH